MGAGDQRSHGPFDGEVRDGGQVVHALRGTIVGGLRSGSVQSTGEKFRCRNQTPRSLTEHHLCTGDTQGTNEHTRGTRKRQWPKNCGKLREIAELRELAKKCGPHPPPHGARQHLCAFEGSQVGVRVQENPSLRILARQNPCHVLIMSAQMTRGWHKLLIRNWGRCLFLPRDLPGASTSPRVRAPSNAAGTLRMRQDHFSTSATSVGHQSS